MHSADISTTQGLYMIPGYILSTLSEELVSAHHRASNIAELRALCIYWRRTIRSFSRGHFVELARTVFDDLLEMSDDDEVKFDAYAALVDVLDDTEDTMHDILRRALNADPSGRGSTHHFACQTYKKVEKISEVLQEMIYFRRDGLECLIRNAQQGAPGVQVHVVHPPSSFLRAWRELYQ